MKYKSPAAILLGSALAAISCLQVEAQTTQTTTYTDGAEATDPSRWSDDLNWNNLSPTSITNDGETPLVHIGTVPAAPNFDHSIVLDTGNPITIGTLTFDNTLTGSVSIVAGSTETLQVNGNITNNTSFQQIVAPNATIAGTNATYAGGTAGLVIGELDLKNKTITATGNVSVSGDLTSTITSATAYGHILGAVTGLPASSTLPFDIHVSTAGSTYVGNTGDFFQIATGTFTGAVATVSDAPLTSGLSWVTSLVQKGILFVEPTAGTTVINSGVVLPIDKDSEFNVAGTAIVFNGTTSAAELLTDNAEDGTSTPFSTARNITINATSNSVIAAMNSTTATYSGVISDAGGTAGTLTIGDSTNHGTVVLAGPSTYTGGTSVVAGTHLEIGNTTGSATGTGAVTLAAGNTLTGIAAGAKIGGQLNLVGTNTLTTTAGSLTLGNLNVTNAGNQIATGAAITVLGTTTVNGTASFADNGALTGTMALGTGTLTGTGSVSGAVTVAGGTISGTGLTLTTGATFSGTSGTNNLSGSESGPVTVASDSSLTQATGGNLSGTLTLGAGATSFTAAGTSTVGGVTLNGGGNTLKGTTSLTTSGITVNGSGNTIAGNVSGAIVQTGTSTLVVAGSAGSDALAIGSMLSGTGTVTTVTLAGTDTLTSTGTLHTSGITVTGTGNVLGTGTITGTITQNANSALTVSGSGGADNLGASAVLTGSGTGSVGAISLAGGNTVTGPLTTGLITVNGTTQSTIAGTVTDSSGATQAAGSSLKITGSLSGPDTLVAGATTLTGTAGTVGAVTINGSGNVISGTLTTAGITVNNTGNTISGTDSGLITQTAGSALTVSGAAGADNLGTSATLTGSGSGSVGAVSLAGGNTLTGPLTTGLITVNSTTQSTIAGTVTSTNGASQTAGSSLKITGSLSGPDTLAAGATTLTGTAGTVGAVTLNGSGNVVSGSLTTGGITVNNTGNTISGTDSGLITQTAGSALTVSGAAGADNLGTSATLTGSGTGSVGALALAGGNTVTGPLSTGLITVNGTTQSTIAGTITSASGASQTAGSSLKVTGSLSGPDTLAAGATTLTGTAGTVGAVTLNGNGNVISGTLTTGGITVNNTNNTISGTDSGLITQTANSALTVSGTAGADNLGASATLTGSGTGAVGAVSLAGGNTITGPLTTGLITVNGTSQSMIAGTVTSTSGASQSAGSSLAVTGHLTGPDTLAAGTTTLTGTSGTVGAVTLNGSGNVLGGTLTTGGITVNNANNRISGVDSGNITQTANSTLMVNGTGGADALAAGSTLSGTGTVGAVSLTGTDTLTSTGTLHTGGITVNNTGNIIYAGSTVAGNTTIVGSGALAINGALTGTMSVGSGTLSGTGTISGATSIGSGGKIGSTSVASGTLSVGGLTTASGSSLSFGIAAGGLGNESKIAVTSGTLSIGGATTINLAQVGSGTLTSGFYSLLTFSGTATGLTNLTLGTTAIGGLTLTLDTSHTGQIGVDVTNLSSTQNFSGTSPSTINIITGATTTVSTTLNNTSTTSTLAVNVADNGSTGGTVTGLTSSGGATVGTGGSTTITGTFTAGTVGTGKTYSISNTDPNALPTTISTGGAVNVYNHGTGTLSVTSATSVKAITGTAVTSTLSLQNAGANNDNITNIAGGTGVTGLSGTLAANQTATGTGTTTAGAAGSTTTANYSSTYTEDQSVIGATAGTQTATAGTVTITNYNHAVGTLTVTSPMTVKAIAGSSVSSTLTFTNAGANNDNLTIQSLGTGVSGLSGTFTANQTNTTVTGTKTAGAAGSVTTATYSATYLEDQSVLGATTGNQTASATVTIDSYSHAVGTLVVTSPTTLRAITGTTISSTLTFTNAGATNDNLIAGTAGGGLTAATGTFTANEATGLTGSFVAGAAGSTTTNTFTQNYTEDQTVIGATTGTQTASASVSVTAYGHSAPTLSMTTDNIGFVHIGETVPNATTTLSNGTGNLAGLQIVSLGGLTDSGTGLIAAGTGRSLTAAVNTSTVGAINTVYTIQTEDDQTILGATANANQTFTVSGNVYSGQGVWNTNGSGSWGTINAPANWTAAGGAPGLDANFTTTDSATFGNVLAANNTSTVTLNGDNPSLKAVTFSDTNAGASYTLAQGTGGTLKLNAGTGNTATVSDTAGSNQITAPVELDSNTAVNVVNAGDVLTVTGNISGASTNNLTLGTGGAGKIVLGGVNTFTGGTTINSGTVQFASANALTSSSSVTVTGGTLDVNGFSETLNNFSSTGGTITNTGATTTVTFDIDIDPVNNSNITGNIAINKTGAGLLALTGNNSYTGGTTITAGTLLAGSATAFGTGNVTNNGGTLGAYGAEHAINVGDVGGATANYTQAAGGSLELNITAAPDASGLNAANDILDVTGTAALAGKLELNFVPSNTFVPAKGQVFEIVATNLNNPGAANGITGDFTSTVVNPPGFIIHLANDTTPFLPGDTVPVGFSTNNEYAVIDSVQLSLGNVPGVTLTPNQQAIANYLSSTVTSGTLFNLISGVIAASPGSVPQLTEQFNPEANANFFRSEVFNNAVFTTQGIDTYLASGRSLNGDFIPHNGEMDSSGLTILDPSMDPALAQVGSRLLAWSPASLGHGMLSDTADPVIAGLDMKDTKSMQQTAVTDNPFSTFIMGNVVLGQTFSQADLAHTDTTTGGVQIGADYRVTPHLRAGVLFGYNHTDGTLDDQNSKATIDSYAPGAYVSFADKGWYVNGIGSYGFNSYTTDRSINIGGASAIAHGAPDGDQITDNIDGGYDFHVKNWTYGPLAGLQYTHLDVNSYQEDGADGLGADLAVNKQQADSLRSRLGGHISYAFQTGKVTLTPHLDASWQHEFMDQSQGINAQLVGFSGGGNFTVTTPKPSRDSALIDAGLNAELNGQVSVFGDYLIQAGQDNYFGQSIQAGVKIGF
jgi:fibronectin-binding autotransporter adhesin